MVATTCGYTELKKRLLGSESKHPFQGRFWRLIRLLMCRREVDWFVLLYPDQEQQRQADGKEECNEHESVHIGKVVALGCQGSFKRFQGGNFSSGW